VEAKILAIREGSETNKAPTIKQSVEEVLEQFQALLAGEKGAQGISHRLRGTRPHERRLKPGEMFVVAARPSMGKTSFMMNIVEHICIDQAKPSMVFSCEMSAFQLVQRLVFARAKFALSQLSRGYTPNKGDLQRIQRACGNRPPPSSSSTTRPASPSTSCAPKPAARSATRTSSSSPSTTCS
jgi:replicative DNA helicase